MTDGSSLIASRRALLGAGLATAVLPSPLLASATHDLDRSLTMPTQEDGYTFTLSRDVVRTPVRFRNRYGIELAGDLYLPASPAGRRLAGLLVSGPFGAVKEQSSGLYANQMAERGFAALAFDPSYTGESGGEPRNIASPDINTEDFSAAVDFLGLHPSVDRERIGMIGICGWGGFALNAAAADKRVKAVVASTMYDISRVSAAGYNDSVTPQQRAETLDRLSRQRWADAENALRHTARS